jgi:hypothetical protein
MARLLRGFAVLNPATGPASSAGKTQGCFSTGPVKPNNASEASHVPFVGEQGCAGVTIVLAGDEPGCETISRQRQRLQKLP